MNPFNKHKHEWFYLTRGMGEMPKRNTPEPLRVAGHICKCPCGAKMLFPDDPKLRPVEVE
jgi:hypothetical protein